LNGGDTFVEKFNRRPNGDHEKTKEKEMRKERKEKEDKRKKKRKITYADTCLQKPIYDRLPKHPIKDRLL